MNTKHLQIQQIEAAYHVKVLYACEAGSRAWGLDSQHSDADLGLIYYRPLDWYLSIFDKPDTIDLSQHTAFDGYGWDLKKALQLLLQSNAIIFDWLQSSTAFVGCPTSMENFKTISKQCFDIRKVMYHYLGLGNNLIHKYKNEDDIPLKTYLLLVRSTLAAMWLKEKATPPPMLFSELLPIAESQPKALIPIHQIVLLKKQAKPEKRINKIPELDLFISENRRSCSSFAETLPLGQQLQAEQAEALFKRLIQQGDV